MGSDRFDKLRDLKKEPPLDDELKGLLQSGLRRLADADHAELSYYSRFDLAYNAAHAFALYALRRKGYRSDKRYLVFQLLEDTAGLEQPLIRVLSKAHEIRNETEYRGYMEEDEQLLRDMLSIAKKLAELIQK